MSSNETVVPDHSWADEDGEPLGGWVEITRDEWDEIVAEAGGLTALGVFSACTDVDGQYGPPRIYTAWGDRERAYPLVDLEDEKELGGWGVPALSQRFRKFVPEAGV